MSIQSVQYAGAVATPRVKAALQDIGNNIKSFFVNTPATYAAQAIGQVFDFGVIPAGSRILPKAELSCAAGAASSTIDIGIKKASDGTVILANGLAVGIALTTAGIKDANNGTLLALGTGYITTEDVIIYGTFQGAANTANQQIAVTLSYVTGI